MDLKRKREVIHIIFSTEEYEKFKKQLELENMTGAGKKGGGFARKIVLDYLDVCEGLRKKSSR